MRTLMILNLTEQDYLSVVGAIGKMAGERFLVGENLIIPDKEIDLQGTLIADICRGWVELSKTLGTTNNKKGYQRGNEI